MPPLHEHWGDDYLGGIPEFSDDEIEDFKKDAPGLINPLVARWYTSDGIRKAIQVIRAIQSKDNEWARFLTSFELTDQVQNRRDLRRLNGNAGYLQTEDSIKRDLKVVNWAEDEKESEEYLNLQEAHLFGANLQGAYLRWANLQGAHLLEANLQGADLRWANLQGAYLFWANLQETDLRWVNLQEAALGEANLQGANLSETNLQETNLGGANLQGANLSAANLQEAYLLLAKLQEAYLMEANLQGAYLLLAKLQGADLSAANLKGATLNRANLQRAVLTGVGIDAKTGFFGADVNWAVLSDFRVSDGEWRSIKGLDKAFISGVFFRDTTMPEDSGGGYAVGSKPLPYEKLAELITKCSVEVVQKDEDALNVAFMFQDERLTTLSLPSDDENIRREEVSFEPECVFRLIADKKTDKTNETEKETTEDLPAKADSRWSLSLSLHSDVIRRHLANLGALKWHVAKELLDRARNGYLYLKNNYISLGRYDDASGCAVREKECEKKILYCDLRLQERSLKNHYHPVAHSEEDPSWKSLIKKELGPGLNLWKWLNSIWRYTGKYREYLGYKWNCQLSDYGESPFKILNVVVWTILLGTLLWGLAGFNELVQSSLLSNGGYGLVRFGHSGFWATLFKSFYCSVISFTTIGFGDVHPVNGWGRAVAAGEAFAGIYLMAMFIWTLGRKVAGR